MKKITIYRSDYNNHKDSEGREYFDYLLGQAGVPDGLQHEIHEVELTMDTLKCQNENGNTIWFYE